MAHVVLIHRRQQKPYNPWSGFKLLVLLKVIFTNLDLSRWKKRKRDISKKIVMNRAENLFPQFILCTNFVQ